MKKVLLIKLTSLGDVIHALPAITDAHLALPDLSFDWVIDTHFQDVARWHPAVEKVFTSNHRVWRHRFFQRQTHREMEQLIRNIRDTHYDLVIDGQGNFKTALLSLLTRGVRAGFDRDSVREWIAHYAYQTKVSASKQDHAVNRLRQLFAKTLGYECPTTLPQFMIDRNRLALPRYPLPDSYLLFVHNASWKTKLWPEAHWKTLLQRVVKEGYTVLLPWGNEEEKARAERLCISPQVQVLPYLTLSEMGSVIAKATACVCLDTGLSHLAAALGVPSVTLYGASDSGLTGAYGSNQIHLQSPFFCSPCKQKQCRIVGKNGEPPCLLEISPDLVFEKLFHSKRQVLHICNT